jgi:hypothetical protein
MYTEPVTDISGNGMDSLSSLNHAQSTFLCSPNGDTYHVGHSSTQATLKSYTSNYTDNWCGIEMNILIL